MNKKQNMDELHALSKAAEKKNHLLKRQNLDLEQ